MATQSAEAAKAIRAELKLAFPGIKFSVKSSNFSMGNAVDITYLDGVFRKRVEEITDKYQYSSFNAMEDMSEITNRRDDIPQAKYVNVNRRMSEELRAKITEEIKAEDPTFDPTAYNKEQGRWGSSMIHEIFWKTEY